MNAMTTVATAANADLTNVVTAQLLTAIEAEDNVYHLQVVGDTQGLAGAIGELYTLFQIPAADTGEGKISAVFYRSKTGELRVMTSHWHLDDEKDQAATGQFNTDKPLSRFDRRLIDMVKTGINPATDEWASIDLEAVLNGSVADHLAGTNEDLKAAIVKATLALRVRGTSTWHVHFDGHKTTLKMNLLGLIQWALKLDLSTISSTVPEFNDGLNWGAWQPSGKRMVGGSVLLINELRATHGELSTDPSVIELGEPTDEELSLALMAAVTG